MFPEIRFGFSYPDIIGTYSNVPDFMTIKISSVSSN